MGTCIMGSGAEDSLRGVARFRCGPGLVCVLAYAATAGPAPTGATTPDSALKIEKSPASQVIYFEESGGLISRCQATTRQRPRATSTLARAGCQGTEAPTTGRPYGARRRE